MNHAIGVYIAIALVLFFMLALGHARDQSQDKPSLVIFLIMCALWPITAIWMVYTECE